MAKDSPHRGNGPLRVLMVSNMYPHAADPGYGIYVHDQVEELRKRGVIVDLLATDRKPGSFWGRLNKYSRHFLNACSRLTARHDVVHLHFPAAPHVISALPVLMRGDRPYVVTIHRGELHGLPDAGFARWVVKRSLLCAARVIAVSRELADIAIDGLGVSHSRVEVINVGFNGDLFRPRGIEERRELKRKLGFAEDSFSLLFVGTLERRKGITVLFDALAKLDHRMPLEVFLAGIGPSESELRGLAGTHPFAGSIHWLGAVEHGALADLYCAADAFVLPSFAEGTPTVMLEAMASGTPAIVTRVGGVPDVIEHGRNGLLFDPGDDAALKELIEQLVADRTLGPRLAEQALADVQKHSLAAQVLRIEQLYRTVITSAA
jgi:glycosyltransferase involved in cell wall biosynthesis